MSSGQGETEKSKVDVHSANSWETADLGDKSRNEKFLRLMGASKKEHHGRFVIGDKEPSHARQKNEERHVEEELEEQYQHSMEHRLAGGRKGHIGLGFHDDAEGDKDKEQDKKEEQQSKDEEDTSKKEEDSPDKNEVLKEKEEKDDSRKRESLDKASPGDVEIKKMKFVKSSS